MKEKTKKRLIGLLFFVIAAVLFLSCYIVVYFKVTVGASVTVAEAVETEFAPGSRRDCAIAITSGSFKRTDVMVTVTISSPEKLCETGLAEFALYRTTDIEKGLDGEWRVRENAVPIMPSKRSEDGNSIICELPVYTLAGISEAFDVKLADPVSQTNGGKNILLSFVVFYNNGVQPLSAKDVTMNISVQAKRSDKTTFGEILNQSFELSKS